MTAATSLAVIGEEALRESFFTAMLLTQNRACAEAAVMMAIDAWDTESAPALGFRKSAVAASLAGFREMPVLSRRELAEVASMLPPELHGVLNLSSPARQCYVLRTLMKWPEGECALTLQLDSAQVARYTRAAASEIGSNRKAMAA